MGSRRGFRGIARSGTGARGGETRSVAGTSPVEQVSAALGPAASTGDEGMDAGIYGLGAADSFQAVGARVDAAGLLARSRAHGGAGQAAGAGHYGSGQADLARDPGSYQSPYETKLKEYEQRLAEIDKELLGKTEEVEELVDAETEELSTSKTLSVDQEIAGNDEIARAETLEDKSPAKGVVEVALGEPLEVAPIQAPRFKRRQTADRGR